MDPFDLNEGVPVGTWTRNAVLSEAQLTHRFMCSKKELSIFSAGSFHRLFPLKTMGTGTFGTVKAFRTIDNEVVCVKELTKPPKDIPALYNALKAIAASEFVIGARIGATAQLMDCATAHANHYLEHVSGANTDRFVVFLWFAQISLIEKKVYNGDMKLGNIVYFSTRRPGDHVFKLIDIDGMLLEKDAVGRGGTTFPVCRNRRPHPRIQSLYAVLVTSILALFPRRRTLIMETLWCKNVCFPKCSSLCGVRRLKQLCTGLAIPPILRPLWDKLLLLSKPGRTYSLADCNTDIATARAYWQSLVFGGDRSDLQDWYVTYYHSAHEALPIQNPTFMCISDIGLPCGFENAPED